MKNKPLYTTKESHAPQQNKRKRRRIGEMSDRLKNELNSLSAHERTRMQIAAAMTLIQLQTI